ncbi:hypothetical protein C2S53_019375 [Perilla frutescens var. hirtella]|uniref:Glycine-rich protein n=1 Tax=Perilla frutescens var. hirtella TaxID=608512 RepID=A0AAD4NWE5_PERFH|nr:hypothetical protein C2S53_019375 [Perilla frutescens var. hirtella]
MQGGRDPFFGFGDPFGSFGGFGRQRSLVSEFFGGRDPFDDPFFRSPFGGMFESGFFGSNGGPFMNPHAPGFLEHQPPQPNLSRGPFMNSHASGFLEHQPPQHNLLRRGFMNPHTSGFLEHHHPQASGFLEHHPPQPNLSRGPVIEELNSDDEEDEKESGNMKKENPRKHGRSSKEPIVVDPDDEATEKKIKHTARWNDMNQMQRVRMQPEVNSFTFQSSSVSYGGANGAFYTTSRTRRSGTDGLTYEEFKEADSSTRQATHRVSRGIHDKGHSVSRKLKSDGHVDTTQTLHNLNEDELVGFEQAWNGNAKKHLPGWSEESASRDVMRSGRVGDRGGQALPSIESSKQEVGRAKGDVGDGRGSSRSGGRSNRGGSSSHEGKRHY